MAVAPQPGFDPGAARAAGWRACASVVMLMAGVINVVNGFSALHDPAFFTRHIAYSNLTFWGWAFIVWGVLQLAAGVMVMAGRGAGFRLGVGLAAVAIVLWFLMVFSEPWAAVVGVSLNVLVVYGLVQAATYTGN
jgi:hypothetical protein